MSIRVFPRTHRSAVAVAGVMIAAVGLSGCSSLGSRSFSDNTVTGSVAQSATATLNQPMPPTIGAPQPVQVASMEFLPPANVGAAWNGGNTLPPAPVNSGFMQPSGVTSPIGASGSTVQTQALPALSSSSSMGNTQAMPAQQNLAPLPAAPAAVAMGTPSSNAALPVNSSVPVQAAANTNGNAYTHTIAGGESLYTIASKYDVTTQAIVHANGLSSPDKIIVGQKIIIPGRSDLVSAPRVEVASASQATAAPTMPASRPSNLSSGNVLQQAAATTTPSTPASTPAAAPAGAEVTQIASVPTTPAPAAEPAASGEKFRWPVSGRVITDFAASRGTGINIDVPEGSSVKAAENGTVIYVGSGVEGYGNLVLIRHPNGYVSAYAHLASMSVAKGAVVNRGDSIGAVGQTGSVSRPQLHFELRKGATPVDPVPLLAS